MTTRVLRFPQLRERGIDFTRKHLRTLESEGRFPRRIQLGKNSIGWLENAIDEWVATRPRVVIEPAA